MNRSDGSADRPKRVSLRHIADKVGVSVPVVSKVLNGGRSTVGVGEETRQRIEQVAARLGYQGRSLPRNTPNIPRGQTVALVLLDTDTDHQPVTQPFLTALCRTLMQREYHCALICCARIDQKNITQHPLLREKHADAVILPRVADLPEGVRSSLRSLGLPTVSMHVAQPYGSVYLDEAGAARERVEHLVGLGHDAITYIDFNHDHTAPGTVDERVRGFEEACHQHHVKSSRQVHKMVGRGRRAAFTREWLTVTGRPHALIVDTCAAAQVVIQTAKEAGWSVPGDLAVASFDDGTYATANEPAITCAMAPLAELGHAAAEMAIQLTTNPSGKMISKLLPYTLHVGGSTDPKVIERASEHFINKTAISSDELQRDALES
ncbi:MAG: LacI family DNA-binding transcriptional regulator [Phycisphaera sp.]|nr:LacI family DNA-binding transcriptional regulator [Phycisphaera sp.]